eukprot:10657676-Alexandrium_andersonii.AAC.1
MIHHRFAEGSESGIRFQFILHCIGSPGQESSGAMLAVAGRSSRNNELPHQSEKAAALSECERSQTSMSYKPATRSVLADTLLWMVLAPNGGEVVDT